MDKEINQFILNLINEIAEEKKIQKKEIINALKEGIIKAYEYQNNLDDNSSSNIRIEINQNKGTINILKDLIIVSKAKNYELEIELSNIKEKKHIFKIGDKYTKIIPINEFSRLSIFKAIQIFKQLIRESEKKSIYDEFINKKNNILIGTIESVEKNYILIKIGRAHAFLPKQNQIPNDILFKNKIMNNYNHYIKFYVEDIIKNKNYGQILASRTHVNFLRCLLELEIPEIAQGVIEIKDIVRIPGIRSKVSIFSNDLSIDGIGACIGLKGERIKLITQELNGEKIDIVAWNSNIKKYIINSLTPAKVISININEQEKKANIIVPTEQLSLAIGKNGIAAKLVARLTNWNINIISLQKVNEKNIEFDWNGNIEKNEYEKFISELLLKNQIKNKYHKL